MMIRQCLVFKPPKIPPKNKRYDVNSSDQFDDFWKRRAKPFVDGFKRTDKYVRQFNIDDKNAIDTIAIDSKLKLAEIALRTRELVGLLLGSTVKKLYDMDPGDDDLTSETESDLDVLILNPHTIRNPRPFEWGVDWFVRPQGRFPTNSNIEMVYDLLPQDGYKFYVNDAIRAFCRTRNAYEQDLLEKGESDVKVPEIISCTRELVIASHLLLPGLYLPEKETMQRIADYCNGLAELPEDRRQVKKNSYQYLVPRNEKPNPDFDFPVMPDCALQMNQKIHL